MGQKCKATTCKGTKCRIIAENGSKYCPTHARKGNPAKRRAVSARCKKERTRKPKAPKRRRLRKMTKKEISRRLK